ncbi:MAG: phosphate ABC transporter substrate-binding protein PstS [Mycobacteriales bacterium]
MNVLRSSRLTVLALAAALALSACGSDNNTSDNTSDPVAGPGDASGSKSASGSPSGGDITCAKGALTGAGSSAQKNAMDEWVKTYQVECDGATVNYQSVGSGAGIQQFIAGTVDFAGSDSALKDDEQPKADARCQTGSAINLPMVVGPIGVAYNLSGVDNLILDAPTIAKIFSDQIKTWNDPAIAALNPDATLPSTPIQAFHRSDSSGTTDNFTKYLKAAAGDAWTFDNGKEWMAPGGQGAKGNEGISVGVQQTDGGVGYLELSFIKNNDLSAAKVETGNGSPVELTTENAGKAVEAAKIKGTGNDLKLSIDYGTKADGVYPIVLVTYEIVCEKGTAADKVDLLKGFLNYTASEQGQSGISNLGYGPLPASFITKVRASVDALG